MPRPVTPLTEAALACAATLISQVLDTLDRKDNPVLWQAVRAADDAAHKARREARKAPTASA